MEKLTNNIAGKVAEELKLNKDNEEVIAYGIFALLNILLSITLTIIFGWIFHVAIEALIVCFIGSILRKYSGGAHASSPGRCAAIGIIICVGQALIFLFLVSYVISPISLIAAGIVVFTLSYYFIYKLAPVDSPAKPIKTKEKRIKMRKGSNLILTAYIIIVVINISHYIVYSDRKFLVYSLCIYGGVAWQIFTLTKAGHNTMNKIDIFLSSIFKIKERRKIK